MREMKPSGIEWIGDIPREWALIRFKDKWSSKKEVAKENAHLYERLALTLKGVIKRPKDDAEGLQPQAFDTYQILRKDDFVFKMIDLQNISTSRVGLSPFEGLVSPAYIRFVPKKNVKTPRYTYYFLMSMYYNCVYNNLAGDGVRSALNASDMGMLVIPSPEDVEQEAIADYLDCKCGQVDALVKNVEAQIEKLKAYKQSLISEVVTKGLDPNAPLKDSGVEWIGKIPSNWEVKKLKYIGAPQNGISKGGEYFGQGYPFVTYGDIYKNMELPRIPTGLIESTDGERETYSVKKGDIFFTRTSETIDEVGFSSVCTESIENATFAGFLIRVRPFSTKLVTNYAKYYFRGVHIRRYLVKEMNLVTRASLDQNLLKMMSVLIPPFSEQQAIADYLDAKCEQIDRLIAIKQRKIAALEQYKKSLIYEVVTGKTDCK